MGQILLSPSLPALRYSISLLTYFYLFLLVLYLFFSSFLPNPFIFLFDFIVMIPFISTIIRPIGWAVSMSIRFQSSIRLIFARLRALYQTRARTLRDYWRNLPPI